MPSHNMVSDPNPQNENMMGKSFIKLAVTITSSDYCLKPKQLNGWSQSISPSLGSNFIHAFLQILTI